MDSVHLEGDPITVMKEMMLLNYRGMNSNPILKEWYNREVFHKIERNFREEKTIKPKLLPKLPKMIIIMQIQSTISFVVKRNIFRFGDLAGGSISKLIGLSDNKIFKSIIGV